MITDHQRQEFADRGFVRIPGVLKDEDFAPVREEFAELLRDRSADWARRGLLSHAAVAGLQGDFEADLDRLAQEPGFSNSLLAELDICLPHAPFSAIQPNSPFHVGPGLLTLMTTPTLIDAVSEFVGTEITASGNQHVRLKLPDAVPTEGPVGRSLADAAASTPWHSDASTMTEESLETPLVTVWIPMRNVGPADGCLMFVPKSHCTPDSVPWPVPAEQGKALDEAAVRGQSSATSSCSKACGARLRGEPVRPTPVVLRPEVPRQRSPNRPPVVPLDCRAIRRRAREHHVIRPRVAGAMGARPCRLGGVRPPTARAPRVRPRGRRGASSPMERR